MRLKIFQVTLFTLIGLLAVSLFRTQVLQGQYYRELGEHNRIRLIPLRATRGELLDRHGLALATSRPAFNVAVIPQDVTAQATLRLAELLKLPHGEIQTKMAKLGGHPFAPVVVARDVPKQLVFRLGEESPDLPGVFVQMEGMRYYPFGEATGNVVGYVGNITPEELSEHRELYDMHSRVGRAGIEQLYDHLLRGEDGGKQIEVDAQGREIRALGTRLPKEGQDVHLAIDARLQEKIYALIADQKAAVGILDLHTDEVLALVSAPSFDPNVFVLPNHNAERLTLLRDDSAPMTDRVVNHRYPPGSVFKIVVALAGLETGKLTPHTRFTCTGQYRPSPRARPFKCWWKKGHGTLNLYEAIERSCNVYFYQAGRVVGEKAIARYARELGLGEEMTLEVTNMAKGLVPDARWKKERFGERWYLGETLNYAIGQGFLLTAPFEILQLVATIAKDGESTQPTLVRRDEPQAKETRRIAIRKEHLDVVKQGMLRVVESEYGTGQLARVDFTTMAAKTGTAQTTRGASHAWFAGFFPYDDPHIALVVFIEHGGSGGYVGAKLARRVVTAWSELYVL